MGQLLSYSICVAIVLVPLYVVYRTILSHTTLLAFNRMVLLSIYAVALILPALFMLAPVVQTPAVAGIGEIRVDGIAFDVIADTAPAGQGIDWYRAAVWIYTFGTGVLACRFAITLVGMIYLIGRGKQSRIDGHIVVRHGRVGLVPFSWCRWIFIPAGEKYADHIVIAHEAAHLDRHHWIDLLVAELVLIIDWYNPAAWQMRDSIQDIHEFQADADVLATGIDTRTYQMFLIKKTVGDRFHALADSLNHSSLKKRITMMLSRKSRSSARLRAMALVPALALGALVIDLPAVASVVNSLGNTRMSDIQAETSVPVEEPNEAVAGKDTKKSDGNRVRTTAEQMPQFPGGEKALYKYVSDNVRFPKVNPIPDKPVMVVVQFEVSSTGKVQNPRVIRSAPDAAFDKEAVRVVSTLPEFIPGKVDGKPVSVQYTLPVKFTAKKTGEATAAAGSQPTNKVYNVAEQKPQFPGGEKALYTFVTENMKMPVVPADAPDKARAIVRFKITATGKVSDPEIIRSSGIPECDAEAIRVVELLPDFTPGTIDNKPVAVWYMLPFSFKWTKSDTDTDK